MLSKSGLGRKAAAVILAATGLIAGSGAALAQAADNFIVRIGATMVSPDVSNSRDLENSLAGGELDVGRNTQVGVSLAYYVMPSLSVELLAATPFRHDISLVGTGKIGSTKHLPPTLSLIYDLPSAGLPFSLYVGAGINYTFIFEEKSSLGDLELSDSVGWAAVVGVDVPVDQYVALNASVRMLDINTDVELDGSDLGELEIDPFVYTLGLSTRF